ncbi:MAG: PadR family transcriptional regulator [Candidatus Bathyarchaeota archaeon]|nr:MAG: PadR family transcriptional regulator [Candidatus Bathyarchaeota archaeon]
MVHRIHKRGRLRSRIGIPKGMLRHITLGILQREPTSGSELMDEIEYFTDWRPSPGSIYPLLLKLVEQGLIEPVESEDPLLKRYGLTETGKKTLEEHRKLEPHINSRYRSIQKLYWRLFKGMPEELFETQTRLLNAIEKIHPCLKNHPVESIKIRELLHNTMEKIESINRQLEKQK